jgi:hypothetical protein
MSKDYGCNNHIEFKDSKRETNYEDLSFLQWIVIGGSPLLFYRDRTQGPRVADGILIDHCQMRTYDARPLFEELGYFELFYCDKLSLKGDDRAILDDEEEAPYEA